MNRKGLDVYQQLKCSVKEVPLLHQIGFEKNRFKVFEKLIFCHILKSYFMVSMCVCFRKHLTWKLGLFALLIFWNKQKINNLRLGTSWSKIEVRICLTLASPSLLLKHLLGWFAGKCLIFRIFSPEFSNVIFFFNFKPFERNVDDAPNFLSNHNFAIFWCLARFFSLRPSG